MSINFYWYKYIKVIIEMHGSQNVHNKNRIWPNTKAQIFVSWYGKKLERPFRRSYPDPSQKVRKERQTITFNRGYHELNQDPISHIEVGFLFVETYSINYRERKDIASFLILHERGKLPLTLAHWFPSA